MDSLWTSDELPPAPARPANSVREQVFGYGVPVLMEKGQSEVTARRVLGQMVRDHGDTAVLTALNQAIANEAGEPVSYMKRCLGTKGPARLNRHVQLEDSNRAVVERMFDHGK